MPDGDAFEQAYRRLAATRLTGPPPGLSPVLPPPRPDLTSPLRWATSSLLPRLSALSPKRRILRFGHAADD